MNPFTVPYGNEVIPEGRPFAIEWTPTTPGPVYLQLSYGDNVIASNITASTSNSGSYLWTPNESYALRDDYFLVICDISDYSKSDCSYTPNGRFSLAASPASASSTTTTTSSSLSSTVSSTLLSSSSTSTSSLTTASSSSTQVSTPTPTVDSSLGLPIGAKVAFGVVIPMFVIVAVLLALLIWKRRRTLGAGRGSEAALGSEYQKPELPGESRHDYITELPGARDRVELPSNDASDVYEIGIDNSK